MTSGNRRPCTTLLRTKQGVGKHATPGAVLTGRPNDVDVVHRVQAAARTTENKAERTQGACTGNTQSLQVDWCGDNVQSPAISTASLPLPITSHQYLSGDGPGPCLGIAIGIGTIELLPKLVFDSLRPFGAGWCVSESSVKQATRYTRRWVSPPPTNNSQV